MSELDTSKSVPDMWMEPADDSLIDQTDIGSYWASESSNVSEDQLKALALFESQKNADSSNAEHDAALAGGSENKPDGTAINNEIDDAFSPAWRRMIAPLTVIAGGEMFRNSNAWANLSPGIASKMRFAGTHAIALDIGIRAYEYGFGLGQDKLNMTETGSQILGTGVAYGGYQASRHLLSGIFEGIQVGNYAQTISLVEKGYRDKFKREAITRLTKAATTSTGGAIEATTAAAIRKKATKEAQELAVNKVDDFTKFAKNQLSDDLAKGLDDVFFRLLNPTRAQQVGQWLGRHGKKKLAAKIIAGGVGMAIPEGVTSLAGAGLFLWSVYDLYSLAMAAPELWKILFEEEPKVGTGANLATKR